MKKSKMKMDDENEDCCEHSCKKKGGMSCVYGLGFVGAAIYYVSTSVGFWAGVWGIIKAAVWPAILIYKLFNFLGA